MKKRIHAFVEGRVQGVWFRETTRRTAQGLGVTGWVRNLADGRVEVRAEGEEAALDQFVSFLRRGPQAARVMNLQVFDEAFNGEFDNFCIQATEEG